MQFQSFLLKSLPGIGSRLAKYVTRGPKIVKQFSSIASIQPSSEQEIATINVKWTDGKISKFTSLFLRDNCTCEQCFDWNDTKQRTVNLPLTIPLDVKARETCIGDSNKVMIEWEDGHRSEFSSEKLKSLLADEEEWKVKLFDKNLVPNRYDFELVCKDNSYMKEFLIDLKVNGLCFLEKVPEKEGQLTKFGDSLMYLRSTNYGLMFQVKSKENPNNLAYKNIELKLHSDLPYYEYIPGIQMLHCIEQSSDGGENTFADGFNIAKVLKEEFPLSFDILKKVKIEYYDIGKEGKHDFSLRYYRPTIGTDTLGNPNQIAYNEFVRGRILMTSIEKNFETYKAYYNFTKILNRNEFTYSHKMEPGECVVFDNKRVLHGRKSFQSSQKRHLEGCYIDWDVVNSFIRSH